jgi:ribose 5-phosphate isomerase B
MTMRVALGADHGGFLLKSQLLPWLQEHGYETLDMGADTLDPVDDYPDFAAAVARAVISGQVQRGILICGSGVGACMAANKVPGIRASLCHDTYSAHQGVEHDYMNVLCLGAGVVGAELARELVSAFLKARFSGAERHRRRLQKIMAIERQALQGHGERGQGGTE